MRARYEDSEGLDAPPEAIEQGAKVLRYILPRHGVSNPRLGRDLAHDIHATLGMYGTGAFVRSVVNHMRSDGDPVGSGGTGYFWAKTEEELVPTIQNLGVRIAGIQRALTGLKKAFREYEPTLFEQNLGSQHEPM